MIPKTLYKSQFGLIATLLYTVIFAIFINLALLSHFCISLDIASLLNEVLLLATIGIIFPIRNNFFGILPTTPFSFFIIIFVINTIFFYFGGAILETIFKHQTMQNKPLLKFLLTLLIITILFIFVYKSL